MAVQRSPNYPAISLKDAVEAAKLIYGKEKRTSISGEVAAKALNYAGLSGPSRTKLSSLKKYGLIEGDERKGMRITELAVRIMYPSGITDQLESLREAALKPELFKVLYDQFRDGSDEAIRSHLINRLDFVPQGAKQVIQSFRETYSYAGLNTLDGSRLFTTVLDEANDPAQNLPTASSPTNQTPVVPSPNVPQFVWPADTARSSWTWTLSMPRSVTAELIVHGEPTKADIRRLKQQIDFLEQAFDDESS